MSNAKPSRRPLPSSPKSIIEYPLPAARQTHELIRCSSDSADIIAITQQTSSSLVKVELENGRPTGNIGWHTIGEGDRSGLHGLAPSARGPNLAWATLQFENKVLLLDVVGSGVDDAPTVVEAYDIPAPGHGPHVVIEHDNHLWITLKDSHHVLQIPLDHPEECRLFEASRNPIFVAYHRNGDVMYASQDQSGRLLRIDPNQGAMEETDIPPSIGHTPVGLIAGPDGNVWFVLAGTAEGGTGTFGKILADGTVEWFRLPNALGKNASLLHLAFQPHPETDAPDTLWLMSSSIIDATATDAIFRVRLRDNYSVIDSVNTTVLPTQRSKAHRVLPQPEGIFVTELATSTLAGLFSDPSAATSGFDETGDYFAQYGYGIPRSDNPYELRSPLDE